MKNVVLNDRTEPKNKQQTLLLVSVYLRVYLRSAISTYLKPNSHKYHDGIQK